MRGLAALLAACVAAANGLATQLPLRIYTTADGLARNAVNCIVSDSRGFLWLCTAEGISRFDGHSFVNYGVEQGLPNGSVNAFVETRAGIYLAATDSGVARLDPAAPPGSAHRFVALSVPGSVYAVFQDRSGAIWAGGSSGLYRIDGTTFREQRVPGRAGWAVASLAEDRAGNLWAGTSDGICRRSPAGSVECFSSRSGGLP